MKKILSSILIFCTAFLLATVTCLAETDRLSPQEVYDKYRDQLGYGTQKEMQLDNWVAAMQFNAYDAWYEDVVSSPGCMGYGADNIVMEILLNEGYYREHIDELKSLNLIRADYEIPNNKVSETKPENTVQEQVVKPVSENITTTKCEEKVMWSKSQVNVRENGSTNYKKVGSLQANEQVTVTGIDSTGWYEIRKSDGTVGHVSEKYLTEEDPSSNAVPEEETNEEDPKRESEIISIDGRTVVWYNAETDKEEKFVFDENVSLEDVEDLAVKHLINGEEMVEPERTEEVEETEATEVIEEPVPVETSEEIKEELVQEEPAETEELEVSEPQEKADETQGGVQTPIIVFVCVLVCLIVVSGIVVMTKAKKSK